MAEREKLIELKDLQITFGTGRKKFVAVDHVNFDIYKGALDLFSPDALCPYIHRRFIVQELPEQRNHALIMLRIRHYVEYPCQGIRHGVYRHEHDSEVPHCESPLYYTVYHQEIYGQMQQAPSEIHRKKESQQLRYPL